MENWLEINRKLWDAKVPIHIKSDFYKVEAFLAGENVLTLIEMEALAPEVAGKKMLHLQCHFGEDSLCWTRLGANVTGVDFSKKAISAARKLTKQANLKAKFIESDIYNLPKLLNTKFDIVFTSFGTIGWLPDLDKWAAVVAHFLKKNGTFYIADFHPWLWIWDFNNQKIVYDYFNEKPIVEEISGTYAERYADIKAKEIGWNHDFSEILTALLAAGLQLDAMKEFDYSPYRCFPNMIERESGKFVWGDFDGLRMPHVYSLKMRKK
jgi:SAM-dependent methyltransferase